MSKHQPYKKIKSFLITERSLNYILRPVQVRKSKYPYTYYVENMNATVAVTVDRAWTPYNHLVMDFIGHELYERGYKKVDKDRSKWKNEVSQRLLYSVDALKRYAKREDIIKDEIKPYIERFKRYEDLDKKCREWIELERQNKLEEDKIVLLHEYLEERKGLFQELQYVLPELHEVSNLIFGDEIATSKFEFRLTNILERYKMFFQERRKEYIKDLLKRTSEVRFTFEYPLRVPVIERIERNGEKISNIKKVDLENIKVENDTLFNVEINGDNVRVLLDTILGSLYFHNLFTLNTDWFEENYLKLEGYASAIYRRFFVTKSGNKVEQLSIKDIVEHFDLLKNSRYPEVIKNAFEDIKNAGLIHDYEFKTNDMKFSKGYIEVAKSSK